MKLFGEGRIHRNLLVDDRMVEFEVSSVQPDPVGIDTRRAGPAVGTITDHRMSDRSEMDPDLMGATGLEAYVQHR